MQHGDKWNIVQYEDDIFFDRLVREQEEIEQGARRLMGLWGTIDLTDDDDPIAAVPSSEIVDLSS